jgi:hypothetical protein
VKLVPTTPYRIARLIGATQELSRACECVLALPLDSAELAELRELELLAGRLSARLAKRFADDSPAPPRLACDVLGEGVERCSLPAGHVGRHRSSTREWFGAEAEVRHARR